MGSEGFLHRAGARWLTKTAGCPKVRRQVQGRGFVVAWWQVNWTRPNMSLRNDQARLIAMRYMTVAALTLPILIVAAALFLAPR
jgi:hypothetical protein